MLVPIQQSLLLAVVLLTPLIAIAQSERETNPSDNNELIVATREVPPFAMQDEDGAWSGISIELLRAIVADLNSEENTTRTITFRDMPLADMLSATERGDVDLAVAALTVNYEREEQMDFSHSYFSSGLGIAVRAERSSGWLHLIDRLRSWALLEVIATLIVFLGLAGFLMYLAERRANRADFGGGFWRGLGAGMWWSIVTLTTVGYGDKAPKTALGRAIASVWMLSGLLIIASFTAAMTSALTVGQIRSRIAGPTDLSRVVTGTVDGSTSQDYLKSHRHRQRAYEDLPQALAALKEGRVSAVVYDAPILRYAILESYPELSVLPGVFNRQEYAIGLPSDSELRERVNRSLLRVTSQAAWEDTIARYLGQRD